MKFLYQFFSSQKTLWLIIAVLTAIIVVDPRFPDKQTLGGLADTPALVYNASKNSTTTSVANNVATVTPTILPPSVMENSNKQPQKSIEKLKEIGGVIVNKILTSPPPPQAPKTAEQPKEQELVISINTKAPVSLQGDTRTCDEIVASNPFYQDKYLQARREQKRLYQEGKNTEADTLKEIACFPSGIWTTSSDLKYSADRIKEVLSHSDAEGKIPVFVLYSQPDHNSARWWNGLKGDSYTAFVRGIAQAIGTSTAWMIVEPDALGLSVNYSVEEKNYRLNELHQVVLIFKQYSPNTRVYLDAGHNNWKSVASNAELLKQAGISDADGFVTNISNYQFLKDEAAYGTELSRLVGNKPFIIDTARNGNGPPDNAEWCNASGRALGVKPTRNTGNKLIDAFFWVKPPGESDGSCNGGLSAGKFWDDYAFELIRNIKR